MTTVAQSPAVKNWLSRVDEDTRDRYRQRFAKFMKWLQEEGGPLSNLTPDELLAYQKEADNGSIYDVLDVIQRYISSLDLRYKTVATYYAVIKSFFMHNRAPLPKDSTFRIRSDKPPVEGLLTVKEIRDAVVKANDTYRAVLLSMFQAGLDLSAFEYWNEHGWESLKEQLRGDPDLVKISLPGRKHRRNKTSYYSFIGRDAVAAIRRYLPSRPTAESFKAWEENRAEYCRKNGIAFNSRTWTPGHIFYTKDRQPVTKQAVTKYWARLLRRMGLIEPQGLGTRSRYGRNLHEFRDVRRSQWEKSPARASVVEFSMGHQIDDLGYNKAHRDEDWVRREYLKAMPMLQLMSSDVPYGVVDLQEVEQLRARVRELESGTRVTQLEKEVSELKEGLEKLFNNPALLKELIRRQNPE